MSKLSCIIIGLRYFPMDRAERQAAWVALSSVFVALFFYCADTSPLWLLVPIATMAAVCLYPVGALAYKLWPYQASSDEPELTDNATVADILAQDISSRWKEEIHARRLETADLISVSWLPDAEFATLGQRGPDGIAGLSDQISDLVSQFLSGRRRLLLVGDKGSGKTALAILILDELIRCRASGDSVPILATLSSWRPGENVRQWIVGRIVAEYRVERKQSVTGLAVEHLVQQGYIIPILDGLDEMDPAIRILALAAINRAFPSGPLILTCRRDEYRIVLREHASLRNASVSRSVPVTPAVVERYLRSRTDSWTGKWDAVITAVNDNASPLAKSLNNPLTLSLLASVYEEPTAKPDELLDTRYFPSDEAIRRHLYEAILDIFARKPAPRGWQADDVKRWLGNLACHLRDLGTYDIALWDLPKATHRGPRLLLGVVAGIAGAIVGATITAVLLGLAVGLTLGLTLGSLLSLLNKSQGARTRMPVTLGVGSSRTIRANGPFHIVAFAGLLGLISGIAFHFLFQLVRLGGAEWAAAATVVPAALMVAYPGWQPLQRVFVKTRTSSSLRAQLQQQRQRDLVFVATLIAAAVVVEPLFGWFYGGLMLGMPLGCLAAYVVDYLNMGWWSFSIARLLLLLSRTWPFRIIEFLEHCYENDALRRAGGVYQFRHAELQDRLAPPRPLPENGCYGGTSVAGTNALR